MWLGVYTGLRVPPIILVIFYWNTKFLTDFRKILKYQISWKSVQWSLGPEPIDLFHPNKHKHTRLTCLMNRMILCLLSNNEGIKWISIIQKVIQNYQFQIKKLITLENKKKFLEQRKINNCSRSNTKRNIYICR